jgi:hypothetical protein
MQLDVFFASAVVVLAGLAVIGALVLVIVWEWRAICCTLQGHRPSPPGVDAGRPGAGTAGAADVKVTGRWLPVGWLLAALVVLGLDARLVFFSPGPLPAPCWCLGLRPWSASNGPLLPRPATAPISLPSRQRPWPADRRRRRCSRARGNADPIRTVDRAAGDRRQAMPWGDHADRCCGVRPPGPSPIRRRGAARLPCRS